MLAPGHPGTRQSFEVKPQSKNNIGVIVDKVLVVGPKYVAAAASGSR